MPMSKCPKCDWHMFEMVEASPARANYKVTFVQCGKCGAVVGVQPVHNPSVQYDNLLAALQEIAKQLSLDIDWKKIIVR